MYRMKKFLHLNSCCIFLPKNPKPYIADTCYSGHSFQEPEFFAMDRFECRTPPVVASTPRDK